jgi:phosphopantetheinyl transferase
MTERACKLRWFPICERVEIWAAPELKPGWLELEILEAMAGPEQARYRSLHREDARRAFLSSRALRSRVVREITTSPLRSGSAIRTSLSHAGGAVAVAASDACEVGVDLEPVEAAGFFPMSGLFAHDEERLLAGLPESSRPEAALRLWTQKEAITKLVGKGHEMDFASFSVDTAPQETGHAGSILGGIRVYSLRVTIGRQIYLLSYAFRNAMNRTPSVHIKVLLSLSDEQFKIQGQN